jgi:molecular chaperone GrpE
MSHPKDSKNLKDGMTGDPQNQPEAAPTNEVEGSPEGTAAPEADPRDQEIAALKDEVKLLKDQGLRALAEVENTRRRTQKEMEDARRYAISTFAQDLLNVLDNFYRTEEHLPQNVEGLEPSMKSLIQGIHLTKNELIKVFESHGIRRVNPKVGEPFDHNLHQAIAQVPDEALAPNSVVQVVQAGYTINDRLLRPAMVSVSTKA